MGPVTGPGCGSGPWSGSGPPWEAQVRRVRASYPVVCRRARAYASLPRAWTSRVSQSSRREAVSGFPRCGWPTRSQKRSAAPKAWAAARASPRLGQRDGEEGPGPWRPRRRRRCAASRRVRPARARGPIRTTASVVIRSGSGLVASTRRCGHAVSRSPTRSRHSTVGGSARQPRRRQGGRRTIGTPWRCGGGEATRRCRGGRRPAGLRARRAGCRMPGAGRRGEARVPDAGRRAPVGRGVSGAGRGAPGWGAGCRASA